MEALHRRIDELRSLYASMMECTARMKAAGEAQDHAATARIALELDGLYQRAQEVSVAFQQELKRLTEEAEATRNS
jgi:hypothetical protein